MFYILFVTNVKHDKHTIRMMVYYDYKYAILLDKLRNGEDFIFFLIWIHYIQGGGVNHPFRWTFLRLFIQFIQFFYIVLLSYAIAYMLCIDLKENMLNRKQWLRVRHVFLSI